MGKLATPKVEKTPLVRALDHVYIASHGPASFAPFCHFEPGGWLVGYDGIVAAGAKAHENVHLAPDTEMFRHACMRAGSPYSITAMPDNTVVVRGNKVRATVSCFPIDQVPNVMPDVPLGPVTEAFRNVLIDVAKLAILKADSIIASAVLISANSVTVTDGSTIVEGWHGCNLPGRWVVPREFADALFKVKATPTHIGWGATTLTIWFGPELWLRTNIYEDKYPDCDVIFAQMKSQSNDYRPIPPDMLQAIETLKPFRESMFMQFMEYGFNTQQDGRGASFTFEHHIPYRGQFPTEGLRMAAAHGQWIAFGQTGAYWYGPVCRGTTKLS